MTKQSRNYLQVGVAVFFAAVIAVFAYLKIWPSFSAATHIDAIFDNAGGVAKGDFVLMSGVDVGSVDTISLTPDHKAKLSLSINKADPIPVGSDFTIKPGLLSGGTTFTIIPSKDPQVIKDGATVQGHVQNQFDDALAQSSKLIATANKTMASTQELMRAAMKAVNAVDDPNRLAKLDATLDNIRLSTERLPLIENQAAEDLAGLSKQTSQLMAGLNESRLHADKALNGAGQLTSNLNSTVTENRSNIRALLRSANDAASSVAGLVDELKSTVSDKDIRKGLVGTTQNLQSVSARLDATASDIQRLADDPRVNSDVRETVSNLKETSESVKNLAARFESIHIPGEKKKPSEGDAPPAAPKPFSATSLLEPGLVFDSLYDTKIERFRFDTDYTYLSGHSGAFYRAGLYDATYGNKGNLEIGQGIDGNRFDYRYGIIAGKLGLGFDVRTGPVDLRLDAFDPNRGTVNARAKVNLNRSSAVTAGIESIGAGNRATVGIQIRR